MSSGGRGSYSIRIDLDASQAIAMTNQLRTQLGSLGASFKTSSGPIGQTAVSLDKYNAAARQSVGASSALGGGFTNVRGALGGLNTQINTTAATLPKMASAQQQAAKAAQVNTQAMQSQIQRATSLASRLGGISFMLVGLATAHGEARGMQEAQAAAQDKLNKATEHYNRTLEVHGKNSFQATRALQQMEKAEGSLAFATRIATLSVQDQFFFIGALASIGLPPLIQGVLKLRAAMVTAAAAGTTFGAQLGTAFSGIGARFIGVITAMTAGLNRLVPAFGSTAAASNLAAVSTARNTTVLSTYTVATGAATAGTTSFGAALSRLALHPVMLVVMALAGAYLVLQQNVFGVTDSLRQFGIALGNAIPVLRPLLDLMDGLAASIGITGEASVDAAERFQSAMEGFTNIGTLWHDTLAQMQQSENEIVRFFGNLGVIISDGLVKAGEALVQFGEGLSQVPGRIAAAFQDLGSQIGQGLDNAGTVLDQFIQGLQQIPARLGQAFGDIAGQFQSNVITPLQNAWSGFLGWLDSNVWQPIVAGFQGIAGAIGPIGEQIAQALGLDQLANWVIQTVVPAIGNAFNQIVGFVQPIGSAIYERLQLGVVLDLAGQVAQGIADAFMAIPGAVSNIGQALWDKLGFGWLADQLSGLFGGIAESIGGVKAQDTPLGQLAKSLGIDISPESLARDEALLREAGKIQQDFANLGKTAPTAPGTFGGLGSQSELARQREQGAGTIPITQPKSIERPSAAQQIGGTIGRFVQEGARQLIPSRETPGPITPASLKEVDPFLHAARLSKSELKALGEESTKVWEQLNAGNLTFAELESRLGILTDTEQAFFDQQVVGEDVAARVAEAHKAYNDVIQKGGTEAEAAQAAQRVLTSSMDESGQKIGESGQKIEEVTTVMSELIDSNKKLENTYLQTGRAAESGNLALETQRQGMLEAGQAALNYGMELEKSTAFNKVWGEIIDTNAFKQAAFATGVQNQVAELNKQKVAVAENAGVLSEYARQVASGEALQVAFTRGQQEQTKSLLDSKVALAENAGALQVYAQQVASGEAQQVAFAQGVQEQQRALLDSQVALAETAGRLQEYAQQLADGSQQAVAFAEGQQAVQESFLDMIRSVSEIQGQISEYDRLLADGTAQTIAFAQGLEQGRLAARELVVGIAATNGETQGFREGLIAVNPALQELGDLSGYTTEQLQTMTEVMMGSQEALRALAEQTVQMANQFGEVLKIDWRDIDDNLEDAIDEVRDSLDDMFDLAQDNGVRIREETKSWFDFRGTLEPTLDTLNNLMPMFADAILSGDPGVIQDAGNMIMERMKKGMDEADVPQRVQDIVLEIGGLMQELANLEPGTTEFAAKWQEILTRMQQLENPIETVTKLLGGMGEAAGASDSELAGLAGSIAGVADAVDTLIQKTPQLERFRSQLEGMNAPHTLAGLADMPTAGELAQNLAPGGAPIQAPTIDLSGAEVQIGKIQQMLTLLGPAAQQATQQMAAAFATLDLTGLTEKLKLGLEPLTLLGPATTQAVSEMSAAFTSLDLTGLTEKLRAGLEPLSLLGPATTEAVGQMTTAFASIDLSGFTGQLRVALEPLSLLGPATQEAVNQMAAAFASIDFSGFTQKLSTAMEPISLLGPATQQAVAQMSAAFGTLDVSGALAALQPLHQALSLLGPATQQAAQQMSAALATVGTAAQQVGQQVQQAITAAVQQAAAAVQSAAQQMSASLQTVGTAAQQVGQQIQQAITSAAQQAAAAVQSAAQQMVSALQTVEQQAQTTAQSFAQIGDAAQQAASVVQSAAQTMVSALQEAASAAEQVAQAISGIGSAAQAAASDVNSLSSAIQAIPDRTVTITVQYQTVGAPPPGVAFGFGMGTRTYTSAGGRTGGAGPGFTGGGGGLGGGQEFGGGGVEPALQHQFQAGLGHVANNVTVKDFNELGILAPVLIDHPMKMLVGENGPELVSVTPVNRNRSLKSGELSPFVDKRSSRPILEMQGGFGNFGGPGHGGHRFGHGDEMRMPTFNINAAQINVLQGNISGAGGLTGAGTPLGTGQQFGGQFGGQQFGGPQQGQFNVPGGQVSIQGNAIACINGQCFGNIQGFGPNVGSPFGQQQQQQIPQNAIFQPIRDELTGMIKPIETLIEWFKFLGLPTGASVPGTGNFTNAGPGTGFGGMGGQFGGGFGGGGMFPGMGGKGATAIAGKGFAMASAGGAISMAGKNIPMGGMFGGGLGGFGGGMTSDPSTWRIVMSQGFGHPVFFVVDQNGFPVHHPFLTVEDAQRFIIFASFSQQQAQQFPQGGMTGGGFGGHGGFGGVPTGGFGGGFGGGMQGGGFGGGAPLYGRPGPYQPVQPHIGVGPHGNPNDWRVGREADTNGRPTGKYVVYNEATKKMVAIGFTTQGWAEQYIILYRSGAVNYIPTGGNVTSPTFGGGRIKEGGWGGNMANPAGWQVVPTRDKKWGNFKVVDERGINIADMFSTQQEAQQFVAQRQGGGMMGGFGGQFGNMNIQGNPSLFNTPFFNNFFGGNNPFTQGGMQQGFGGGFPTTGGIGGGGVGAGGCVNLCGMGAGGFGGGGATATAGGFPGGIGPGMINMTGGNINFDQNQGEMELRTSTGAIAIAGRGGAFAQAGRAGGDVGLFGGETLEQTQERRQLDQINQNLEHIGGQIGQQNFEFNQFQQQQQFDFATGFEGLTNQFQQFPGQIQTAFGTGMGQLFQTPGFTGFGQSFQQFPGGGAVGSGTNDPLGFLNSQLGGFGIPTPAGIPGGGGVGTGGVGTGGAGGCISLCQDSINAIGGGNLGGGGTNGGNGGGNGGGGGGIPNTGNFGGGPGEPAFQGGGGGVQQPAGGGGGGGNGFAPTGNCQYRCRPMDSDPNRYRIDNAQGNESNGGVYYNTAEQCNQRLQELCPSSQNPGNNMTPAPQQPYNPFSGGQQPTFGQPGGNFGGSNQVSISISQSPPQGFGQPGIGGVMGPIGNPPVPPRIVQSAGLPSQAPNVNQDPTKWSIVESAGLVGTYDIIDDRGNVVQLGFRTIRDAEIYLNYFISFYKWIKSGSTGIPGPVPVGGGFGGIGGGFGGIGGGAGGFPGGFGGGVGGGGITATAGNAQASAGGGGAFAQAGNALAIAGGGFGSVRTPSKMIGPTPVPDEPFDAIPRAQGPFRSGQDNQEPIYDNSGIKIGADFGSPGERVTMEEETEGGGKKKSSRLSSRLAFARSRIAFARARAGGNTEALAIIDALAAKLERMFGDLMINLVVNNSLDGNMINRSMARYQLRKVSVFS